jgi:hypothetical protein
MRTLFGVAAALVLGCATVSSAQGVQTGTLTGTVIDQIEFVLPGVTVTVTSPALQGVRTTHTDWNGVYRIPGLPPGTYTVRFDLAGFRTVEVTQRVDLGLTARLDAALEVAGITEQVQVTADAPNIIAAPQGGANLRATDMQPLAVQRTVLGLAELAPGVSTMTPNDRQLTIAGGFAYDNQIMVDGVDIADNIFGQPNFLFIEDAIQDTQVLVSGISSEFGRFSGGVVNAITRSGGNDFRGTFRVNFYSPSWTAETPLEKELGQTRASNLQENYEGTFGGPIVRDRLWFFSAGRRQATETPFTLPETGAAITRENRNNRWETKITGTVAPGHTVQGSYLENDTREVREALQNLSIDPRTVVSRQAPNDLWVVSYRGVVSSSLFAQAQVTGRRFGLRNNGGTETTLTRSPFRTRGALAGVPSNRFYNAPYFDATDPEDRNNRQVAGSLTWFRSTDSTGSHSLKAGFEDFQTTFVGGNSQSATGYVFRADYLAAAGVPVLDANGHPIPVFMPGQTRLEHWMANRSAQLDIRTSSFYVQDRWAAGSRVTLDLGTRLELVTSSATGGVAPVDAMSIVPRLGASVDLTGRGRWLAHGTYAHYAGRYSENQYALGTVVANPALVVYQYTGLAGEGMNHAPGFDLSNYQPIAGNFPTANVSFDENLKSPLTKEFTIGFGAPLATGGFKATYQWRRAGRFFEDFIDDPSDAGKVTVIHDGTNFGTLDRVVFRNTDVPTREYQALLVQGNHRMAQNWRADASWTLQLRNHGNFEGELPNQPGVTSDFGKYPEMLVPERNFPSGRLDDFQRHRVRAWTAYSLADGLVDLGLLYRFDSPRTFSYVAHNVPLTATQLARDPGYAQLPGGNAQTLYFGERGAGQFNAAHLFDVAATLSVPVLRELRPWVKLELLNAFNNQQLAGFNTQVTPDWSVTDEHGLPVNYLPGPQFGNATAITHYPRSATTFGGQALYARTIFLSAGVRF